MTAYEKNKRQATKVFAKAGLDNETSAMCYYRQRFRLDVHYSTLVHIFNFSFSIEHLYRAGRTMNSLPSQILERCRQFYRPCMQTVGQYQIDIYRDEIFTKGSVDNMHKYDIEHFDESEYVFPTMFGIKVFKDDILLTSAIIGSIGGGTGFHKTSIIYEDTRILICCSDSIFCLSIPNLQLLWRTKADQATCFEIYKYQDSYIIHGELEISRLDKNGKIVWQQSGADIFTTIDGKQGFKLTDEFIVAVDFENRVYKFDYDGNSFTDKIQFS